MRKGQHSLSSNGSEQLDMFVEEASIDDAQSAKSKKQSFANLYWSGVISCQLQPHNGYERRAMGPDVKQEKELYDDLEVDEADGWQLLYDPHEFNEQNKPLMLEKYQLTKE